MNTKWDLTKIYQKKEEWEQEKRVLEKEIDEWEAMIPQMLDAEENLTQALKKKITIDSLIEKIYCYPRRFLDLNSEDEEKKSMFEIAKSLYGKILKLTEIFSSTILKNEKEIDAWLRKNPHFKRYIEIIRTTPVEKESNEIDSLKQIYRSLTEQDLHFGVVQNEEKETVPLTRKLFQDLIRSQDESVRKEALTVYYEAFEKNKNTLALLLNQKYNLERKEKGTYQTLLEKNVNSIGVPKEVVTNLIAVSNKKIPVLRNFMTLKKELLKRKELHIYDTSLSVGLISKMEFEIEEAVEIIKNSLAVLGEEYITRVEVALKDGWVDVFPSEHKRKMSYSCISYCGVPYASLNYNKSLVSVRTLIHELGHSIHTSYAKEQGYIYFEYSLFLAEIVSKVNEILLNEYLLKQEIEKEEKIYLVNNIISSLGVTLFSQTLLTEFEHTVITKIEREETLNAESLSKIYKEIFQKYYGETIITDVDNSYEWTRIPHLMMNQAYYLYQYPIGVSIALEIVRKIETIPTFKDKYIQFLKIGNSKNVIDSLKELEIDLQNDYYVENAYQYFEEKIELLKELKKKD